MFPTVASNSPARLVVTDIIANKRKYPPEEHVFETLFLKADFAGPLGVLLDKMNLEQVTVVAAQNIELLSHY